MAFTGQAGGGSVNYTGAATIDKVATTVFTAPSNIVCIVNANSTTSTQSVSSDPAGTHVMWPLAQLNGSNTWSGNGVQYSPTVLWGHYTSANSRAFTISSGTTVRFGCHITGSLDFADPGVTGSCRITYSCTVP